VVIVSLLFPTNKHQKKKSKPWGHNCRNKKEKASELVPGQTQTETTWASAMSDNHGRIGGSDDDIS
jgi:hypothetical protein